MPYGITSDVSGLTRLPRPEFPRNTAHRSPATAKPAAIAYALPSSEFAIIRQSGIAPMAR